MRTIVNLVRSACGIFCETVRLRVFNGRRGTREQDGRGSLLAEIIANFQRLERSYEGLFRVQRFVVCDGFATEQGKDGNCFCGDFAGRVSRRVASETASPATKVGSPALHHWSRSFFPV